MKTEENAKYPSWISKLHGSEFKVQRLQEAPAAAVLDNPEAIVDWLKPQLAGSLRYSADVENLIAVHLNTRRRPIGWTVISNGSLDTLLVHAREVFRDAIVSNAAAVVLVHNHPSGDPTPSEADVRITRDLIKAGQLLKIELLDHLVITDQTVPGYKAWQSLRELGYFYA
jgi:DNA repair protein RadC